MPISDGLVVQWPDTHCPEHHPGAVRHLTNFIGEVNPAEVILTGDFLDFLPVGRWSADTLEENGRRLQREIDAGIRILSDLRDVYGGTMNWLPGNHEARLAKWGHTRGKGVFGLDCLTVPSLLDFDGFGIGAPGGTIENPKPYEFASGVLAIHGDKLGQKAGQSVTKELDRFNGRKSVVMGHCHRLSIVYRHDVWGVEGGHLMDQRKADYLSYGAADWQMGFSVIEVSGKQSHPHVIPMRRDGSFSIYRRSW